MLSFILVSLSTGLFAQGVTTPRPSPAATASQTIGISTVTVNYSRPSVNGREIWGNLVPYGWNVQGFGAGNSAPWRAGANENTVITLSHAASIQGQAVPAGSYGLFFVVNKDNTGEVILSKDYKSWGSFFYDAKLDQLRAPIQLRDNQPTEQLTYDFINVTKNAAELVLNWERKQFPVKIEFATDEIVMQNAKDELNNVKGFTAVGWSSAANYALQNKQDYYQALQWVDRAIQINDNFNNEAIKANILRAMDKPADADKIMTNAVAIANETELNAYGYQLLGNKQNEKAISIFVLNTQRHPTSANVWDSLGEAYALSGDKKNAIASFKKSLSLNPPAATRINSEKYMKQLGAM
jgi:tetratricopeptide (TPR) repeat protein